MSTVQENPRFIRLRVKRQAGEGAEARWDTFQIDYREKLNVISALMEVRRNPQTINGESVEPPAWEAACLEEVCGSCTMNINGSIRQACTALLDDVGERSGDYLDVTLEPMKKFPLVRDLIVDRSRMFDNLIKVKAWVPIDGSFDRGMAEPQDDGVRQMRYALSRCMTCGCCMEACPQVNDKSAFVGPAAVAQALLFNLHPVGKTEEADRLEYLTSEEGITGCGNAQNCVKVCPKAVPLTQAIAQINRDTTVYKLRKWMGLAPR
ncbi:MAG TPA: succinate dehydrogenase iron-sulfur subunit [Fimbriimonadaceae bacterium]|nr:succinate dehydrogenase iron-sulfur subunit [Fimbriimonadaceae bacterium]